MKRDKKDFSEVVIFGGNLEELQNRYPDRNYQIANDFTQSGIFLNVSLYSGVRKQLARESLDGLIHANTHSFLFFSYMTGVPVKKID